MKELVDLNFEELDSMEIEEKKKLLDKEFEMYEINNSKKYLIDELSESSIVNFLDSVMNSESNHQITQGGEYPAKNVADIFNHSNLEKNEFFENLRILYLNDYIEYFTMEEFDISKDSRDVFYENVDNIDSTYQLRFNLHRLFKTDNELFNEERFYGLESIGSEARMYSRFLFYGTIVDKICSLNTLVRLSNKGMHYLHFFTSKRSIELMYKQEETLKEISETKTEQSRLLKIIEGHKLQQDSNIKSINSLIDRHSKKIKDFYKDITTILSLMLAAFALIGVNISAIPKIESNFTANLLAMNLSLILCLLVLFYILKVIVYDTNIQSKHFYSVLTITVLGIIGVFVFLGFNHESKIEVIEKKYQKIIKDYKVENEQKIKEMEQKIESLEKKTRKK